MEKHVSLLFEAISSFSQNQHIEYIYRGISHDHALENQCICVLTHLLFIIVILIKIVVILFYLEFILF